MSQEFYGINIFNIQEIIKKPEITPLPNSRKFIAGIINLRGDIIPIINLENKFHIASDRPLTEVIIIRSQGQKLGLIVEKVFRVFEIEEKDIAPPPSIFSAVDEEYILGVSKTEDNKLIIFLDIEFMFFDKSIQDIQEELNTLSKKNTSGKENE